MTYAEATRRLYDLQWFGLKLGLENTFRLAALAGNPQARLRFIHVAGTNGKGSTCAMLESIYRTAGLRVGLFTSPHLVSFSERIQVNRQPISPREVARLVERVEEWLAEFPAPGCPTFFEVVTVMALLHFAAQGCDLVIWETGMGGRLDATNIVTPLASVITNIQYDHEKWLGSTLAQIAAEKAGIIKPGVVALTACAEPEALAVIRETARARQARLVEVGDLETHRPPLDRLELPLLGEHQRLNAALALATVQALQDPLPLTAPTIAHGLRTVQWAGRLQVIRTPDGRVTVLDGAHNPAGASALRAALREYFPGLRPTLVLGVLRDKDWSLICRTLAPLAGALYLVPVASPRTTAPEELQAICAQVQATAPAQVCGSLAEALHRTDAAACRVITGSLYLVGEALERLDGSPLIGTSERSLNEWQLVAPAGR